MFEGTFFLCVIDVHLIYPVIYARELFRKDIAVLMHIYNTHTTHSTLKVSYFLGSIPYYMRDDHRVYVKLRNAFNTYI